MAAERSALLRRMRPLLRWRYLVFLVLAFGLAIPQLDREINDWPWFVVGSELLFHDSYPELEPGGLHLYANHPAVQIGPLALLEAEVFRFFGNGRLVAVLTTTAMGPALVYLAERTARRVRGRMTDAEDLAFLVTVFVGGLFFSQCWVSLAAYYTHPDDALVLGLASLSVWAIVSGRRSWVGALLGLALAAKPWAMVFTPLILVLRGRERWRAAIICGAIAAAAWLPFIIADSGTLDAMKPHAATDAASVIRAIFRFAPAPDWLRPVQLIAALLAGVAAVQRGRWPAVLAVGIAVRLLLDPGVNTYYTSGLLVGTVMWDFVRPGPPSPTWTTLSFWTLGALTTVVPGPTLEAVLRLLLCTALVLSVVVPPRDRSEQGAASLRRTRAALN